MADQRFITLATAQPKLSVTAMRGVTPPVPAGGYGGWTLIARPKRKSLTQWDGIEPRRILVPIILGMTPAGDGLADDTTCEPARDRLERMAQPPAVGSQPPIVTVTGAVPHASVAWVIEDFDWDPNPDYSRRGFIVRQAVTVHLLEHVNDQLAAPVNAAELTRQAATKRAAAAAAKIGAVATSVLQRIYIVGAGDTLPSIAAAKLGSAKRWTELATLNGLRDPNRLTVGQKLRLP